MACVVQIIALILGSLGMLLTCIITGMRQWRISILVESDAQNYGKRIDGQWLSRWDGLWMTCVMRSRMETNCNDYNSMVSLTPDLKAGRILMSFAVGLSIIAFITAVVGMLFKQCYWGNGAGKNCLLLTAGITYILAGVLVFIPVTWTAANITRQLCTALCQHVQQQHMGEALFLGWPTALLLFITGSILCWFCPCTVVQEDQRAYHPKSVQLQDGNEMCRLKTDEGINHCKQEYI